MASLERVSCPVEITKWTLGGIVGGFGDLDLQVIGRNCSADVLSVRVHRDLFPHEENSSDNRPSLH